MASMEQKDAPSSVQQLQDVGKAAVGAAGTVAVDRVRAEVDARSSRFAIELKAFAVAGHASAASLREQGHGSEADIVDRMAGRADRLAVHLATASSDELVEDAKQLSREAVAFARREPVLAIAGAFTIGLLIPRVLDAIGTKRTSESSRPKPTPGNPVRTSAAIKTQEPEEMSDVVTPEPEEDA